MDEVKIIAFMQSPNLPDRPKIYEAYRDWQDVHRRFLLNSMSGRRLKVAFGDWFEKIHWDNANPVPHTNKPCVPHMRKVINEQRPDLIITIGKVAHDGMQYLDVIAEVVHMHHPNARGYTQADLTQLAERIITWIQKRQT